MAGNCLPIALALLVADLSSPLHARLAWRLTPIFLGALFSQGRQTVGSWLRANGQGKDFRRYYYFLGSLGRKIRTSAGRLLLRVVDRVAPGDRLLFAIDDSPTKRYGRYVEGAALHHNPTPGPSDQKFLYGHVWVALALIGRHPCWGPIALPILATMYVRQTTWLPRCYKVPFQTKLEQAADLVTWAADWLERRGKSIWVVVDGFYFKRVFLKAALRSGVVVIGRLRKDAALRTLPIDEPKRRGRKPKYGKGKIDLAKRAGQKGGWTTGEFILYGEKTVKRYKTFHATYAPAYGMIRVVLVKEKNGWFAWACTNPDATVAEILEAVADRFAIEQAFHDLKEVHGAGKQQLRHYFANVAAFNLVGWLHTLIELWAWDRSHKSLCDRGASPWDDATRRPSHANRRNALRRECWKSEIKRCTAQRPIRRPFSRLLKSMLNFAVGP